MSNETDDVRGTNADIPRRVTMEGRSFGRISYADDDAERTDDARRATTGALTVDVPAPRISSEGRNTGARRRMSGS